MGGGDGGTLDAVFPITDLFLPSSVLRNLPKWEKNQPMAKYMQRDRAIHTIGINYSVVYR